MDDDVTHDTLLRGRVQLFQPARGFRSSLDPLLLTGFLEPPFGRFLDVGCGTGAVAFLLLARDELATGVALELQARLAALAMRGVEANGFRERLQLRNEDARRTQLPEGTFDLVVTNPPFRPLGKGPLPPDREKAAAHHEVSLALADWLGLAARVLKPGGRLAVIFPASRADELAQNSRDHGLAPTRRRLVIPRPGEPAARVLFEARRGPARDLVEEPPLVVHAGGGYSAAVRAMLGE